MASQFDKITVAAVHGFQKINGKPNITITIKEVENETVYTIIRWNIIVIRATTFSALAD